MNRPDRLPKLPGLLEPGFYAHSADAGAFWPPGAASAARIRQEHDIELAQLHHEAMIAAAQAGLIRSTT